MWGLYPTCGSGLYPSGGEDSAHSGGGDCTYRLVVNVSFGGLRTVQNGGCGLYLTRGFLLYPTFAAHCTHRQLRTLTKGDGERTHWGVRLRTSVGVRTVPTEVVRTVTPRWVRSVPTRGCAEYTYEEDSTHTGVWNLTTGGLESPGFAKFNPWGWERYKPGVVDSTYRGFGDTTHLGECRL
jgi:hypothetical protein